MATSFPTYVQYQVPPVDAGNLNELNRVTYTVLGNGVLAPLNAADVIHNLGLSSLATMPPNAVAITGGSISGLNPPLAIADGGTGGPNPQGGNQLSLTLRNLVDNGAMNIVQRYGNSIQANIGSTWVIDRWQCTNVATARVSFQQLTAPLGPPGFVNRLHANVVAAGTPVATDVHSMSHTLENFTILPLNFGTAKAAPLVLSFWVICSIPGTFCISICPADGNRSYVIPFTITTINTFQKFVFQIPGDIAGTWAGWNGGASQAALAIRWSLGAGTNYLTPNANVWQNGNFVGLTGMTQLVQSPGASMDITGVQLEVGLTATPFETLPYSYELQRAMRFLPTFGGGSGVDDIGIALFDTASHASVALSYLVPPRAAATSLSPSVGGSFGAFNATTISASAVLNSVLLNSAGSRGVRLVITQAGATWTVGQSGFMFSNTVGIALHLTGAEI
jgi:hypothetical protein